VSAAQQTKYSVSSVLYSCSHTFISQVIVYRRLHTLTLDFLGCTQPSYAVLKTLFNSQYFQSTSSLHNENQLNALLILNLFWHIYCLKHAEVVWRNELQINSASSWCWLQRLSRCTVSKTYSIYQQYLPNQQFPAKSHSLGIVIIKLVNLIICFLITLCNLIIPDSSHSEHMSDANTMAIYHGPTQKNK
jgi:hypothetical protein